MLEDDANVEGLVGAAGTLELPEASLISAGAVGWTEVGRGAQREVGRLFATGEMLRVALPVED